MSAGLQVLSFIFSFSFGCFFALLKYFFNKIFLKGFKYFKFFLNIIFVIFNSFIYMYILYKINYGVLHLYFILMFLIGYYFVYVKMCK